MELFDDDKRNETGHAFSIQNIVETGLMEHGRLPGEWYGVSKMNEIFQSLNETYNFDTKLSENILGSLKICNFKNGEINSKEILDLGVGKVSESFEKTTIEADDDNSVVEMHNNGDELDFELTRSS